MSEQDPIFGSVGKRVSLTTPRSSIDKAATGSLKSFEPEEERSEEFNSSGSLRRKEPFISLFPQKHGSKVTGSLKGDRRLPFKSTTSDFEFSRSFEIINSSEVDSSPIESRNKSYLICSHCGRFLEIDSSFTAPTTQQTMFEIFKKIQPSIELEGTIELEKLFHIACTLVGHHFPLCQECFTKLFKDSEKHLNNLKESIEVLRQFHSPLHIDCKEQEEIQEKELESLLNEEKKLLKTLEELNEENQSLLEEEEELFREEKRLQNLEQNHWQSLQQSAGHHWETRELSVAVLQRLQTANLEVERFARAHVLNDMFHIWHDGFFGTINQLRLGRLPSIPVDWNEINAAFGYSALLLDLLSKYLQYSWKEYRILFKGSFSRMEYIKDKSTYELFGTADISLGKLFSNRRFDIAMVALLNCEKELASELHSRDKTFSLKYKIDKDLVGGESIKMTFSTDVVWTQALKHFLVNLKFLLGGVIQLYL